MKKEEGEEEEKEEGEGIKEGREEEGEVIGVEEGG